MSEKVEAHYHIGTMGGGMVVPDPGTRKGRLAHPHSRGAAVISVALKGQNVKAQSQATRFAASVVDALGYRPKNRI